MDWDTLTEKHPELARTIGPLLFEPASMDYVVLADGTVHCRDDDNPGCDTILVDDTMFYAELGWEDGEGHRLDDDEIERIVDEAQELRT